MSSRLFPQYAKTSCKNDYKQGKFCFSSLAIASDHGGEELKKTLIDHLKKTGFFETKIIRWKGEGQQKEPFSLKSEDYEEKIEKSEEKNLSQEKKTSGKKDQESLKNKDLPKLYDLFVLEFSKDSSPFLSPQSADSSFIASESYHEETTKDMSEDEKNFLPFTTSCEDLDSKLPHDHKDSSVVHYPHCLPFMLQKVSQGSLGILICTSGVGMAMAVNRFPGIRGALCCDESMAYLARTHNNANVLVLGAEFISNNDALNCLKVFLTTPFAGGRHELRLNLLESYGRLYKENKEKNKKTTGSMLGNPLVGQEKTITILGAGAWGQALGKTFEKKGVSVMYWNRVLQPKTPQSPSLSPTASFSGLSLESKEEEKKNQDFLSFKENNNDSEESLSFLRERYDQGRLTHNLSQALKHSSYALLSISAQGIPSLCQQIKASGVMPKGLVICSKGLEVHTGRTMGSYVSEILEDPMIGVLSGPNLAKEVFQGLPCGITFATQHKDMMDVMRDFFSGTPFLLEVSSDFLGLQIAGALKNVFAMAYGFVQGFWANENLWATYFALGAKELGRLIVALGGQGATLLSYGGLGDLFLTCNSLKGRNSSFGRLLAHQWKAKGYVDLSSSVLVEGLHTLPGILLLCKEKNISSPLLEGFQKILEGQKTPEEWRQNWV